MMTIHIRKSFASIWFRLMYRIRLLSFSLCEFPCAYLAMNEIILQRNEKRKFTVYFLSREETKSVGKYAWSFLTSLSFWKVWLQPLQLVGIFTLNSISVAADGKRFEPFVRLLFSVFRFLNCFLYELVMVSSWAHQSYLLFKANS